MAAEVFAWGAAQPKSSYDCPEPISCKGWSIGVVPDSETPMSTLIMPTAGPSAAMLFLDGAYKFHGNRGTFHRACRPDNFELNGLLDTLSRRTVRVLERRGLLIADPVDPVPRLRVRLQSRPASGRLHRLPYRHRPGGVGLF
jgi:hypothetical protein